MGLKYVAAIRESNEVMVHVFIAEFSLFILVVVKFTILKLKIG